jgi:ribosomal protein S14
MSKTIEPAWVCQECAEERGARVPLGHQPTYHEDECGLCGQEKMVTEPRDFGVTRKLLKKEIEDGD